MILEPQVQFKAPNIIIIESQEDLQEAKSAAAIRRSNFKRSQTPGPMKHIKDEVHTSDNDEEYDNHNTLQENNKYYPEKSPKRSVRFEENGEANTNSQFAVNIQSAVSDRKLHCKITENNHHNNESCFLKGNQPNNPIEKGVLPAKMKQSNFRETGSAGSSQESSGVVTSPQSLVFSPENSEYDEAYNDVLNLMEKLKNEKKKEQDNDDSNDSGQPQSGESSSICPSSTSSTRRSSASMTPDSLPNSPTRNSKEASNKDITGEKGDHDQPGEIGSMPIPNQSHIITEIAELALEAKRILSDKVENLQFAMEEKEKAVEELNHQLTLHKTEYEDAINRHQNFIDQLIKDKKGLIERNDKLTLELSNCQTQRIQLIEERKGQNQWQNCESRQDNGKQGKGQKAKRIKEHTLIAARGLKPEIQRLLTRHKAEIADLEADRERRLKFQDSKLHEHHLEHIKELKYQWEEENEERWIHERQTLGQKHNQQLEETNSRHQEEIERLQEQLERERARSQNDRAYYEKEATEIRRIERERSQAEIDRISKEEEGKRTKLNKKHANEITTLKETEATKRKDWERNTKRRMEEEWKIQEDSLRESWTKSRKEAAKKNKELIVVKVLLKQKEADLQQALEGITKMKVEREAILQKLAENESDREAAEKRWKVETEKEAQKIHERVRKVIEKKEETIYKLLRYCDQATEKCQHLETQLERQAIHNYVAPKVAKLATKYGPNSAQSYLQLPLTERFG